MNEFELARQEARAKRQREAAVALAEIGISSAEATLFQIIHFGLTVPPADMCRRAAAVPEYSIGEQVSFEEYEAAIEGCLSKGWLRIVDEAVLASLQDDVRQAGLLGPVYGYPYLGGLDFTRAGAEQWLRFRRRRGWSESADSHPYSDVVHVKLAKYFPTKPAALRGIERIKESEIGVVSISEPSLIGPWRAKWWQRLAEGYRVDVESRMQWEGVSPEYTSNIFFHAWARPLDVTHAKDVLARHKLPLVAWWALTCVDEDHSAAHYAKQFGENFSDKQFRAAVQVCIEVGWLQAIDERAIAEIKTLLQADNAVMPVPFEPTEHMAGVDFTVAGAEFYRKLSAEILGCDWEDANDVEEVLFMEAHHYCATEAGIAAALAGYAERGKIPMSCRTEPIGPWCVYWWKQFPSGYRLELTFGKQ